MHADDLGADHARNSGIFAAMEAGVVTAASILANGPAFGDCVQRIAAAGYGHVSFGIHLNLTEGRPVRPDLKLLTGPDGFFLGKRQGLRLLMDRGDRALEQEIRKELIAQIAVLRAAGIRMDHADGHQHVHVFPAVAEAAFRTAAESGIPWMRIPEEPSPRRAERIRSVPEDEAERFCRLAAAARVRMQEVSLKTTDHFRGLYLKGNLSLKRLDRTLETLPPGLTELMVHPGRAAGEKTGGPFSAFSGRAREKELAVLMSGSFRRMLEKHRTCLTSFPEAGL